MPRKITNVSLLFEQHEHCLKLGYEKEIANSEGPILTIYMDTEGRHSDLYLFVACLHSPDYICVKIDQDCLLRYLNNNVVLQELIFSCPEHSFLYLWHSNKGQIIVEIPTSLINQYPIAHLSQRILGIPAGMLNQDVITSLKNDIGTWKIQDPKGEEQWFLNEDTKQLIIDAGLYLKE